MTLARPPLPLALVALVLAACTQPPAAAPSPQPTVTVTETETVTPPPNGEPEPADPCVNPPTGADLVFATSPGVGTTVTSPFTVRGCSSTFEANVQWRLLDRDGQVIADGFTMGGTFGQPEGFEFQVSYTVPQSQIGLLQVYESSALDGSELHLNSIPLVLQP